MALGLHGVGLGIINPADDLDGGGLEFDGLTLGGRIREDACDDHGAACGEALDLCLIVLDILCDHGLQRRKARAIVYLHEGKSSLGVTAGPDPTFDADLPS